MKGDWEDIEWCRDHAHLRYGVDSQEFDAFIAGAEWGAGWMAAIIGMGEAIRERHSCMLCPNLATVDEGAGIHLCQSCWLKM